MRTLLLIPGLLLALAPGSADGQAARRIATGDAAHAAMRPHDALETFEGILDANPGLYEALWRASRESVNLGMLNVDPTARKTRYAQAEGYARRARAANPAGVEGAEWLAIALGRTALDQGVRSRVRFAEEIRTTALEALALDSTNAGAHHVLGEWHAEIRRLSGVERWMARKLLGGDSFDQASWSEAEAHLQRAVDLDPAGLIHHLGLAQIYLDTDRPGLARVQLRQVLALPSVEPVDPLHKQTAQVLLRGLTDPVGASAARLPDQPVNRLRAIFSASSTFSFTSELISSH
jgi:tetratricopeptide (TPR) repeat protein